MWLSVVFSVITYFRAVNVTKIGGFMALNLYAGLVIYLLIVPSVFSQSDRPSRLTYDQIYNSTTYAQIRHASRPVHAKVHVQRTKNLLVGVTHDPFRYSVPEADYRKGVRIVETPQSTNRTDRGKRGVSHLYNMLTCATGCNPIAYKGYGCYCGLGGSGRPADGIDNCCRLHDECYENIHCPFYTVYFQPYYWTCFNHEPLCALENFHNAYINGCAGRLCECDRRFAMCVRQYTCPIGRPLCKSSPFRLLQNILIVP
ncbi:unnamed protein product [Pieris brassicae]|uniref:Phospholipase A2 n=1 Tax=Pieris brassicae TaxID=7116 RepID=A0A9P0X156_PIEBR|nr:unnamed protein product [Pieris brassicae]